MKATQRATETTKRWRVPGALAGAIACGALLFAWYVIAVIAGQAWAGWIVWASLVVGLLYAMPAAGEALGARKVDIDVLMVLGAVFAAAVGHPEEGSLLLFLFVLSGALEDRAMERTKREVESLHALMPTQALVRRDGAWVEVPPESLAPGDEIRIRPGESVPVDAVVVEGASTLDQSALTGESIPRGVGPGDAVFAGTINRESVLTARVTKAAAQSSVQRILRLVTEAREQREPMQRLIDRFSEPYTWGVLIASTLTLFAWRFGLGREWKDAAYTAITLLIVASPCALIIATPTATLAGIARGAKRGVLFKGGDSMERLSRLGAVCFDKTGTLTVGRPRLDEIRAAAWSDQANLLAIAAGLEADSTHPLASAIREGAAARGIAPAPVREVKSVAGRGLQGLVGAERVAVGNAAFTHDITPECLRAHVRDTLGMIRAGGAIGTVVARSGAGDDPGEAGVLVMRDVVRPGALDMVRELHLLGVRPLRMLTGDNRVTAELVARDLGLDAWDAELLPEDKLKAVKATRSARAGAAVGVIGDGVNDAPALAAADVSIAIGSIGSDAALESADIVLLSDDLGEVPWAVRLARRVRWTIRVNLAIALSVIVLMGLLTTVGSTLGVRVPLGLGVLAHEGGTLLVVANSLRILWFRGRSAGNATLGRSPVGLGAALAR
jgi:Cd2+/Zn2+-exporting ATPase